MIRSLNAVLVSLCLLAPLAAAEGTTPDASDLLFQTEGTMVATIKKLGKLKQKRSFAFFHGSFDFGIDDTEGGGISGFLDPDFKPARLEADETGAEDWFREAFEAWAADQEALLTLDEIALTSSTGKAKVRPAKLTLVLAWSLSMTFDVTITVDGEQLVTTAKMSLKGKGARDFLMGGTEWEVDVKLRASVPKLGNVKDDDAVDLTFNPDNTIEIDDPLAGLLRGTWVVDEKSRVTVLVDTETYEEDIGFAMEDIVQEVQFETFKFLDDGELELKDIVVKVRVKAGVSITYSMTFRFQVTGTTEVNDVIKPVSGTARYTVRGKGCLD